MPVKRWPEIPLTCKHGHESLSESGPEQKVDCRVCKRGDCPQCGPAGRRVALWMPKGRPRTALEAAALTASGQSAALIWGPPSSPRYPHPTSEECPRCAGPLRASSRGTQRDCVSCGVRVIPAGARDAYQPSEASAGRTVRSQDDRDDEGLALAERASELLAMTGRALSDGKLHHASRARLEWYEDEIRKAVKAGQPRRVEHLAGKLADERIRRQHWWDGAPEAITAGGGQEDGDGEVYEAEIVDDGESQAVPALGQYAGTPRAIAAPIRLPSGPVWTLPGRAGATTWAAELDRAGWRIVPSATGCQVSEGAAACGQPANRNIGLGLVCYDHYQGLSAAITTRSAP